MKKGILIALLVTVCLCQEIDIKGQLDKIDENKFGRTLLDTVFLQLQTREPIERLVGTLQQLEDRYYSDQKEDDEAHKEYQDACSADLTFVDNEIKISDTERINLEARLEGELYPKREIIQKLINKKTSELNSLTKELNELDQTRAEEEQDFEEKVAEHQEVMQILAEVKTLFSENLQHNSNPELIQIARLSDEGMEMLQKHFTYSMKKANKFSYRKSWGKMFKALATITTRVEALTEPESLNNILSLIDQLYERVEDSLSVERFAEKKRIEAYDKARNLLTISINATNTALANAQSDLAIVEEVIAQTLATLENTNQRLEILEEQRNDRFTTCEIEAKDYQDSRAKRDEDRNVVSETLGLLNRELRGLKEQLAMRMQAGETFD